MIFKILIGLLIIVVLFVVLLSLIGTGLQQKFGRFDMPVAQLNKFICELLFDESINESELPVLRDKLLRLGFTTLSEEEIINELKDTLHNIENFY